MKTDIPLLMRQRQLDAAVVQGNTDTSSDLAYLTGGAGLERALILRGGCGADPVVRPIERELAAATGYDVHVDGRLSGCVCADARQPHGG